MYEINKANVYCSGLDGKTLAQFQDCLKYDWVVRGALMPDAHLGYSMPIGGVILTDGIIVPAWVGYDIGCGVCAVPTTFDLEDIVENRVRIYDRVLDEIPMGPTSHPPGDSPVNTNFLLNLTTAGRNAYEKRGGSLQLGTLGGGNHFIELCSDENQQVWAVIHSGSRGFGHEVGGYYMKLAKHLGVDSLGFMLGGRNASNYIQDMNTCIQYALSNRRVMMEILEDCIWEFCMGRFQHENMINKDHNHAERTSEGILHRKGATDAKAGNMGVIPGNMSVGSCIVKGLGNEKSLKSCSHGAGRAMSRSKAKENLNIEDFECSMEGVTANVSQRTIDESPMAYKEFSQVMLDQEGLCEVVHNLRPIINWKE